MQERFQQFLSACLAGILIGVGGTVYLSVENTVVGAFLFGLGLFTIVSFGFRLFTGKVGYLLREGPHYLIELAIIWLGNLTGTFLMAMAVYCTRISPKLIERAQGMANTKLADHPLSILLLSVFCGLLMFIAVDIFRSGTNDTARVFAIFLPVMVFILSGFEHVVANMFYFSLAGTWSVHTLLYLLIMTLGNSIGGLLIPACRAEH